MGFPNHLIQALNKFLVVSGQINYLSHAQQLNGHFFFLILSLDHFGPQAFTEDSYNEYAYYFLTPKVDEMNLQAESLFLKEILCSPLQ